MYPSLRYPEDPGHEMLTEAILFFNNIPKKINIRSTMKIQVMLP